MSRPRAASALACLLALGLLVAAGCDPAQQRSGAADYAGPPADRAAVVAAIRARQEDPAQRIDEFDEMILVTNMDGTQLGAFMAAVQDRVARIEAFDQTPAMVKLDGLRGRLAAAKKAKDEAAVASLVKEIEPLQETRSAFYNAARADVVGIMTLDQQRDWATFVLWDHWGRTRGHFRRAALSDDQLQMAEAICADECRTLIQPGTMEKDPYLWVCRGGSEFKQQVRDRIAREVLTDAQREAMAPKK